MTDADLKELLPTVAIKGQAPVRQVWLTQKDAIKYARSVLDAHIATHRQCWICSERFRSPFTVGASLKDDDEQ